MIRLFECFAGYGTTTFALKQLGLEHELIGFSEIDKYAVKCFQQNHGGTNYGDITKIDWSCVPDFDLLTGGFPCQAFSTAGKQLGEADARGVLGLELTKALIMKQPKYFLFENVKGFMSKKFKETREKFIKSWEEAGYVVHFKVLNTKDFGVPQNRERVWFIGIRKDVQQSFKFPEPFELKLKLKDILEEKVDAKYFLKKEQIEKIINSTFVSRRDLLQKKEECSTLRARDYKEPKVIMLDVSQIRREGKPRVYGETSKTLTAQGGGHTPLIALGCAVRAFPRTGSNDENREQRLELNGREEANSITTVQNNSMVVVYDDYNSKIKEDSNTSCTLTQNSGAKAERNGQKLIINSQVRRLTPKECFRLQGFLNDEVNLDGLSDTQKYKLAGNGQSVNVVKFILMELLK